MLGFIKRLFILFFFNIYNSPGAFFINKDYGRAKLCLEQARTYAENIDMPLDDVAILFHNLSAVDLLSGHDTNNL